MSDSSETTDTFHNGHVELDSPVDWAEGSRVSIAPLTDQSRPAGSNGDAGEQSCGISEADYQDTPEFRNRLLAQMDAFLPLELTPAEEAEWEASRQWIKDYTLAAVRKQMGL
jgi:hypothetical protein